MTVWATTVGYILALLFAAGPLTAGPFILTVTGLVTVSIVPPVMRWAKGT